MWSAPGWSPRQTLSWFLDNFSGIYSKYSQTTTVIFAVLFLGLGAAGFYFSIFKPNMKIALLIDLE